ncbi:MAG: hypothetical protein JRH20_21805, partial [Deltaproteobacteria bacterium]|nr:hypothetical protein [Deltaproteobacteria bacterium]
IKHPTLLLDPTASANFARDAKPGGLLNRLLQQLGKEHRQRVTARQLTQKIAKLPIERLLVLTQPNQIKLYREALELAAKLRRENPL